MPLFRPTFFLHYTKLNNCQHIGHSTTRCHILPIHDQIWIVTYIIPLLYQIRFHQCVTLKSMKHWFHQDNNTPNLSSVFITYIPLYHHPQATTNPFYHAWTTQITKPTHLMFSLQCYSKLAISMACLAHFIVQHIGSIPLYRLHCKSLWPCLDQSNYRVNPPYVSIAMSLQTCHHCLTCLAHFTMDLLLKKFHVKK